MDEGGGLRRWSGVLRRFVCGKRIVIAGKTPGLRPGGGACRTRRLALAAAHNIQPGAREREGSQQPEGVQVTQHRNMALGCNEYADGNGNGQQKREMRRSPQRIALLDKLREELHA